MENIMHGYEIFKLANMPDEYQVKFIEEINEAFVAYGLRMNLETKQDVVGKPYTILEIRTDRKWKPSGRPKVGTDREISTNEIRKMMETMSAAEVAAELGISRSTLFRRLKK